MVLNFIQGARANTRKSGELRHWNRLLEQVGEKSAQSLWTVWKNV